MSGSCCCARRASQRSCNLSGPRKSCCVSKPSSKRDLVSAGVGFQPCGGDGVRERYWALRASSVSRSASSTPSRAFSTSSSGTATFAGRLGSVSPVCCKRSDAAGDLCSEGKDPIARWGIRCARVPRVCETGSEIGCTGFTGGAETAGVAGSCGRVRGRGAGREDADSRPSS